MLIDMKSLMTYSDALAALIKRMSGAAIDGHSFTFEYKSAHVGHYVLRATDDYDGKTYTVTIQPEGARPLGEILGPTENVGSV